MFTNHPYEIYLRVMEEENTSDEEVHEFDLRGLMPRQYRERKFNEDLSIVEYKQRFRVPRIVVDILESRLTHILTYPSRRNNPLSARQQILMFLFFTGTNSVYHVVKEARGPVESCVCRTIHR